MPRYAITAKAGRFVAGQNNTGVGSVLNLTEKQAEHEIRLGSLHPLDAPTAPQPESPAGQTSAPPAPVPDAEELSEMTVKELRALADERGLVIDSDARRAEIVAAIEANAQPAD